MTKARSAQCERAGEDDLWTVFVGHTREIRNCLTLRDTQEVGLKKRIEMGTQALCLVVSEGVRRSEERSIGELTFHGCISVAASGASLLKSALSESVVSRLGRS